MSPRRAAHQVRKVLERGRPYPAMREAPADCDVRPDRLPLVHRVLSRFPRLWALWIWCHGPRWRRFAVAYARWIIANRGEA